MKNKPNFKKRDLLTLINIESVKREEKRRAHRLMDRTATS